jgi:N-acetylglucosaminyldiphosphoundecaprenol N-acetyl-beta-D-mannosaminyltransferase
MRDTVEILGVPVDKVNMGQAVEKLEHFLTEDRVHTIYTPNAEIMMAARRDAGLKGILAGADLLVADGAGVVLASKILGLELPEKVSGFDLVKNSMGVRRDRRIRYFLFGGKPHVAEEAGFNMLKEFPGIEIAGCNNGYFTDRDEEEIISRINSSGADVLLVALGAPKQEKWIHTHKNALNVKICIGVGGSLDVFAGISRLAPEFFRRNGLEWLYRLYREPWRYKRMLDLPRFILLAFAKRFHLVE